MENFEISDKIYNAVKVLSSTSNQIFKSINPAINALSEYVSKILKPVASFYSSMDLRNVDKEVLKEYTDRYSLFGKYGWCIPLNAPLLIQKNPKTAEDADNYLLKTINTKILNKSFKYISKTNFINEADLNESISNFRAKKFKSCALLLFSIIDGLLFRVGKNYTEPLNSLNGIIKQTNSNIESYNAEYLFYKCQLCAFSNSLQIIYKHGNNFKKQPQIINRNFLSHGMLKRDVNKCDCLKIITLLENLCFVIKQLKLKIS